MKMKNNVYIVVFIAGVYSFLKALSFVAVLMVGGI